MQEPEIAVKKVTWKDFETGEIYEDSTDISYYKCQLLMQKYDELTLGDFNCDGNYVIAREILEELVKANKYITDYENGVYHLVAKAPSLVYELKFLLKIAKKEDKMVATLSLCEVLSTGLELTTDIARYKDDDNIYFLQKVAKVFHIVEKKDSASKEEENETILQSAISLIKKFVANKQAHIVFVNNESKEYIEKIVEKLKTKTDKFSKYVLKEYSRIVEDNKKHLEKPNYYTKVRKALDKVINSSIKQCEDEDIKKTIKEQRKTFAENVNKNEVVLNAPPIAAAPQKGKSDANAKKSGDGKTDKNGKGGNGGNKGGNGGKGKADKKDKDDKKNKDKKGAQQQIIPTYKDEKSKTAAAAGTIIAQSSTNKTESIEDEIANLKVDLQSEFEDVNTYINNTANKHNIDVSSEVSEKGNVLEREIIAQAVVNDQINLIMAGLVQKDNVQQNGRNNTNEENILNL